jgi:hypothetical protein
MVDMTGIDSVLMVDMTGIDSVPAAEAAVIATAGRGQRLADDRIRESMTHEEALRAPSGVDR